VVGWLERYGSEPRCKWGKETAEDVDGVRSIDVAVARRTGFGAITTIVIITIAGECVTSVSLSSISCDVSFSEKLN